MVGLKSLINDKISNWMYKFLLLLFDLNLQELNHQNRAKAGSTDEEIMIRLNRINLFNEDSWT